MSKHVPVSLWIPGNRKGDFGNGGEDECKKNEPDRRGLDPAIQRKRPISIVYWIASPAMTKTADADLFHTLQECEPGLL
jgi:hypothetical protein